MGTNNRKKVMFFSLMLAMSILITGCSVTKESTNKIKDIDFTVVGVDEQPDELKDIISEKGDDSFQITYVLGDSMYIAVGYGKQDGGGYSISVNEFYESEENLCIDTTLIGPGNSENVTDTPTTPYIVIKTETVSDKPIIFN